MENPHILSENIAGKTAITVIFRETSSSLTEENKSELESLARTLGIKIVQSFVIRPPDRINPATYIGQGKIEEMKQFLDTGGCELALFETDLSPVQQRNLENQWEVRVIDRTGLILSIFARHANTAEGKLQVELAQLTYMFPRLTGSGTALSRLAGTIGTRGPGEQKLEIMRRRIRERIRFLNDKIKELEKHRNVIRNSRARKNFPVAALVGYTNVGKSTLINKLIHKKDAFTDDRLFSTLDPLTRSVYLDREKYVLVSDTVGLLSSLPHHLIAAFKATLEELKFANLLILLFDATSLFIEKQRMTVDQVIALLDIADKPVIVVCNKIDLAGPEERNMLSKKYPEAILVSAVTGDGISLLKTRMNEVLYGYENKVSNKTD